MPDQGRAEEGPVFSRALAVEDIRNKSRNWSHADWENALVEARGERAASGLLVVRLAAALGRLEKAPMIRLIPGARALIQEALRG